jgi:hypothetical protein
MKKGEEKEKQSRYLDRWRKRMRERRERGEREGE